MFVSELHQTKNLASCTKMAASPVWLHSNICTFTCQWDVNSHLWCVYHYSLFKMANIMNNQGVMMIMVAAVSVMLLCWARALPGLQAAADMSSDADNLSSSEAALRERRINPLRRRLIWGRGNVRSVRQSTETADKLKAAAHLQRPCVRSMNTWPERRLKN